jgi:hypothetical protein
MAKIAHARLDDDTHQLLVELSRATGESESELIRRGLEVLAQTLPRRRKLRIFGLGKFESGVPDLGSNKAHLSGFGKS